MSIFLAMAAAGATWIGELQTQLSATEAEALDIVISVVDAEREHRNPYPLFLFDVDLGDFNQCKLRGVSVGILDERGQTLFSSALDRSYGTYSFQIMGEYLELSTLFVSCDAGPDATGTSYAIELSEFRRAL